MRSFMLVCVLLIAGVSADTEEVAPTQTRIFDLWLINAVNQMNRWMIDREYDPLIRKRYEFDEQMLDGFLRAIGYTENLELVGASTIFVNYANYLIHMGRLEFDLILPELKLTVGRYVVDASAGFDGGRGVLEELSVTLRGIRVQGHCLLRLDPGPHVHLYNINVEFSVAEIKGEIGNASWTSLATQEKFDVTERVLNFINIIFPGLLQQFRIEINVLFGEAIRRTVNRWW